MKSFKQTQDIKQVAREVPGFVVVTFTVGDAGADGERKLTVIKRWVRSSENLVGCKISTAKGFHNLTMSLIKGEKEIIIPNATFYYSENLNSRCAVEIKRSLDTIVNLIERGIVVLVKEGLKTRDKSEESKTTLPKISKSQVGIGSSLVLVDKKKFRLAYADDKERKRAVVEFFEWQEGEFDYVPLIVRLLESDSGYIKCYGNGRACFFNYDKKYLASATLMDGITTYNVELRGADLVMQEVSTKMTAAVDSSIYHEIRSRFFGF